MMKCICLSCGTKKCSFISQRGGNIDIHSLIGKLPKPKGGFTLPSHKYTGPYNPLDTQLDQFDNPLPGQEPFNQVDSISLKHHICYRDKPKGKEKCDKEMLNRLSGMESKNVREKFDKKLVQGVIGAKHKLGWEAKK